MFSLYCVVFGFNWAGAMLAHTGAITTEKNSCTVIIVNKIKSSHYCQVFVMPLYTQVSLMKE